MVNESFGIIALKIIHSTRDRYDVL